MLQNRIQNCKLFGFPGGRQGRSLCNLQSTSVLERTGREERCAKVGCLSNSMKKAKNVSFQHLVLRNEGNQSVVRCVPLDLQLKKSTSIGES